MNHLSKKLTRHHRFYATLSAKLHRFPLSSPRDYTPVASAHYLRIVTFNMQHGRPQHGWPDTNLKNPPDSAPRNPTLKQLVKTNLLTSPASIRATNTAQALEDTAKILRELCADIICLQEVDKGQRRSGYLPEAEFLANLTGMPYWRMTAAFAGSCTGIRRRPLHTNITRENGCGIALLSRWPVKSWHVKRLGRSRWKLKWGCGPWPGFSQGFMAGLRSLPAALRGVRLIPGEMRVLQAARILTPFGSVALGNTHLETNPGTAQSQLRRAWKSVFELSNHSCALTGDFNLQVPDSAAALRLLDDSMTPSWHGLAVSFPADSPQVALNQLLVRGWVPAAPPRTVRLPISDHLAIVYDLKPCVEPANSL